MARSKSVTKSNISFPSTSGTISMNSNPNIYTVGNPLMNNVIVGNATVSSLSNNIIGQSTNSFGSSTTGYVNYIMPKSKYNLLGKEIELDGYKDSTISMLLTHINLHGIIWYIEFKKQYVDSDIPFPEELAKELEREIIAYKRDKHISDIISD